LREDADLETLVANLFTHVDASNMARLLIHGRCTNAEYACKWDEYVSSLCAMLPWMIAYDNNKYGRWLPDF